MNACSAYSCTHGTQRAAITVVGYRGLRLLWKPVTFSFYRGRCWSHSATYHAVPHRIIGESCVMFHIPNETKEIEKQPVSYRTSPLPHTMRRIDIEKINIRTVLCNHCPQTATADTPCIFPVTANAIHISSYCRQQVRIEVLNS